MGRSTVVESRRLRSGKVAQRQVLYLGEINDSQQSSWRRTLEVFDEERHRFTPLSLFPEDRPVPADAVDSVQVKLSEMKLERARPYGNCWLGCELWRQLQLDRFWAEKLRPGRESVAWPQVLELLVVNRLIDQFGEYLLGLAPATPYTCPTGIGHYAVTRHLCRLLKRSDAGLIH